MITIRNFSGRLWSPGLLYDRSRSWSRSSTALLWMPTHIWTGNGKGNTVRVGEQ